MGKTIYTPGSISIPIERQRELADGWRELDSEQSPFRDIPDDEESLEDRCQKIITELSDNPTKKEQLIALYLVLNDGNSMIAPRAAAEVVDCTLQYARSFSYDIGGKTIAEGNRLNPSLRQRARSADNHRCVRCGTEEDLQIHHIIPYEDGGVDSLENLITLCGDCHWDAHGETWSEVDYDSKDEFEEWLES
jgi:Restriction endonuclease